MSTAGMGQLRVKAKLNKSRSLPGNPTMVGRITKRPGVLEAQDILPIIQGFDYIGNGQYGFYVKHSRCIAVYIILLHSIDPDSEYNLLKSVVIQCGQMTEPRFSRRRI